MVNTQHLNDLWYGTSIIFSCSVLDCCGHDLSYYDPPLSCHISKYKGEKMQKVVTVRWSDSVNFLLVIEIFLFKVVLK